MDLENAIQKMQPARSAKDCVVAVLIDQLDETNRKAFLSAMERNVPVYLLTKALRSEGLRMSEESLRSHKAGICKCATK